MGIVKHDLETARRWCRLISEAGNLAEAYRRIGVSESTARHVLRRHGLGAPSDYVGSQPGHSLEVDVDVDADTEPSTARSEKVAAAKKVEDDVEPRNTRTWATPQQRAALDAVLRYGSIVAAAEAIGMTPERLRAHLAEADRRASAAGWSPQHDMTHPVPAGYHVRGVSTLYGPDGSVKGQWVKSAKDREAQVALLLDAVQEIAEPFKGRSELPPEPSHADEDLLAVYPMGDPHLGMYAWAEECGESFDLETAERNLVAAVDRLASLAPPAALGLVINLGDFFHTDSKENRTLKSGNVLDVDARWAKILAVGIRTMRRCIDRALERHRRVRVVNEIGNHDSHSAVVLSLCLASYYENNPRVEVDTSPSPFHWLRFGRCLIGVTHGDGAKLAELPGIMASDRAKDWGETSHRYWYTGHIHHDTLKEFPGCTIESFRTLAPRDAWHHGAGYRAGRDMKLDVIHADHGKIVRHVVGIEQVVKHAAGGQ
jgi:hypothetical protein